jgi:large subunit ribosomal protein L23
MKDIYKVIKAPVITEKSTGLGLVGNKFAFWVDLKAGKGDIKEAVQKIFGVTVIGVQTQRVPGKIKRMGKSAGKTSVRKKAYITLKEGDKIEALTGV